MDENRIAEEFKTLLSESNEICEDLSKAFTYGACFSIAENDKEEKELSDKQDDLIAKYSQPFTPDSLIQMGWEKEVGFFSKRVNKRKYELVYLDTKAMMIKRYALIQRGENYLKDGDAFVLFKGSIPKYQHEFNIILKSITGE